MPRAKVIEDPDRFLGQALNHFHSANWHRAALMFRDLHEHVKQGGDLPYDWRWRSEGEWSNRHRRDTIVARKVGVLVGLNGAHHTAECVDATGPGLKCSSHGHRAPDCAHDGCHVEAAFIFEDRVRCDHHYRIYSSRQSLARGYGGKPGTYTGD